MTPLLSQVVCATVLVAAGVLSAAATKVSAQSPELVVVLADTGRTCQSGLPVLTRHPQAEHYRPVLTTGMSGRLVRAYRLEQQWLAARDGRVIEPAYLLLSSNQGGFPRTGFCLDGEPKPQAGFVDLPASQRPSGAFGAIDQIFPHEQLHVILHQLAGEAPDGGANQVHAIGVRTDPERGWVRRGRRTGGTRRHAVGMFLGEDLLAWLVLAFGGALFVGNLLAVVRPPQRQLDEGNLERAPVVRSIVFAGIGLIAAVWALASLISG